MQLANLYELYINGTGSGNGNSTGPSGNSTAGTGGNSTTTTTGGGTQGSGQNSTADSLIRSNATSEIGYHRRRAQEISEAILDLNWDRQKAFFYVSWHPILPYLQASFLSGEVAVTDDIQDFNLTSNARESFYSPAGTFPLWQNVTPPEMFNNETLGLQYASGWRYLLGRYGGITAISSLVDAGLNWDFPNSWPPHTCECNSIENSQVLFVS